MPRVVRRASPGESSQRKDPAGVGQVAVTGAAVVVNGNAGFGEQGKVPVESAEAAPTGKGPGTSCRIGTSCRTWRVWKRGSGRYSPPACAALFLGLLARPRWSSAASGGAALETKAPSSLRAVSRRARNGTRRASGTLGVPKQRDILADEP